MDLQKADSKEYLEFIDKFAPKTTTDDCFTPPLVYDAVRDWVCKEYGVDKDKIARRFLFWQRYVYFILIKVFHSFFLLRRLHACPGKNR